MINNAKLIDKSLFIQAGINPKTKLPFKFIDSNCLKNEIKKQLRILDEQNAVNRYVWYNLPCDISSQELERFIYYKGQLCFFYNENLDKFFFMPYALDGTIDFYGRYNTIHPVPISSGVEDEKTERYKNQLAYLSTLKLNVKYDIPLNQLTYEDITNSAVLLHDYTKQLSESIIPRQQIQDYLLDIMAECVPMMRTALRNSTGVQGMRVGNQDEEANVLVANSSIDNAVLNGLKYIPIIGNIDFQDLTNGNVATAEEFLMAMQSLDNYRLGLYGLDNGGVFSKNAYVNQAEIMLNQGIATSPLQDGLLIRQRFCDIINGIWGLGVNCEISETALKIDDNFDGKADNSLDNSGVPGDQQEGEKNE